MRKSLVCRLVLVFALIRPVTAADELRPGEVGQRDAHAVRAVVEAQLKALATDQFERAYSYAAPAIQQQFHDAARFAEMVRSSYPMLIRPASVSFYRPEAREGTILQTVQFRDRQGRVWRAVYQLQQLADKTWRISGCAVAPGDDSSTT